MGKAYTHWPTKWLAGERVNIKSVNTVATLTFEPSPSLNDRLDRLWKSMEIIGTKPELSTCFESFRGHPVLNGCCLECSAWTRLELNAQVLVCLFLYFHILISQAAQQNVNNHFPLPGSTNHRIAWPTCWCQDILHRYTLAEKRSPKPIY